MGKFWRAKTLQWNPNQLEGKVLVNEPKYMEIIIG